MNTCIDTHGMGTLGTHIVAIVHFPTQSQLQGAQSIDYSQPSPIVPILFSFTKNMMQSVNVTEVHSCGLHTLFKTAEHDRYKRV